MTNILPFQAKPPKEVATISYYDREPTADEAQQIAERLSQLEGYIQTLRTAMIKRQVELSAVRREVEKLLPSLMLDADTLSKQHCNRKADDAGHE